MKFAVYVLFVVLPSLCVCTPLPDVSADANSASKASVQTAGGGPTSASADSNSNASVNVNNSPATPSSVTPTTGVLQDTTSVNANSSSSSDANVTTQPGSGSNSNVQAGANSSSDASVSTGDSGSSGKPTQQGFTNYSVLKVSSDEFTSQIDKTTWFVAKYTASQEEIQSEVTVCADRHIGQNCKAVKFQYVTENGNFVFKEWGYDGTNLIYIQENISFSAQDFVILKADVVNVMKATKDSKTATSVSDSEQVKSALSAEYAVLGTDYKNYFIGQTSSDEGAITFVAFTQQIYECEEQQQQYSQQITQILQASGIDESKLSKLTQKFDVDTNQFTQVSSQTSVSPDGSSTTVSTQKGDNASGQTLTNSSVSINGSPSPSGNGVDAGASSSSDANVNVNNTGSGVNAGASSSSDANVNVNNTGTPSPATTSPSSISANSSGNSNASVNSTGAGPTSVNAGSTSNANVQTASS